MCTCSCRCTSICMHRVYVHITHSSIRTRIDLHLSAFMCTCAYVCTSYMNILRICIYHILHMYLSRAARYAHVWEFIYVSVCACVHICMFMYMAISPTCKHHATFANLPPSHPRPHMTIPSTPHTCEISAGILAPLPIALTKSLVSSISTFFTRAKLRSLVSCIILSCWPATSATRLLCSSRSAPVSFICQHDHFFFLFYSRFCGFTVHLLLLFLVKIVFFCACCALLAVPLFCSIAQLLFPEFSFFKMSFVRLLCLRGTVEELYRIFRMHKAGWSSGLQCK